MTLYIPGKTFLTRIRARIRKYIDCLLEDSHTYHTSLYPGNSSFILKRILKRFTTKVQIDDHNLDKIKQIDPDSVVIFASKTKHVFNFLYFHTYFKDRDLPYPELWFDFSFFFTLPLKRLFQIFVSHMDYFLHHFHFRDIYTSGHAEQELTNGKSGFVCLIEEDDFYNRFIKSTPDPLFHLIEFQNARINPSSLCPKTSSTYPNPCARIPG